MARSWLVLAVLCGWVGVAEAKRIECACPAQIVLPERHAAEVPINAKIWRLAERTADRYIVQPPTEHLTGVTIEARPFSPEAEFRHDGEGLQFFVGDDDDREAPHAPRGVRPWLASPDLGERRREITTLSLYGDYDPSAPLVRVDIRDEEGWVSLLTTRDRLYVCDQRFTIVGDEVTVEVRSIDLAGNESPPLVATVAVEATSWRNGPCGGVNKAVRYRRHGHGYGILIGLFCYGIVVIGWVVFLLARNAGARRHPEEDVSRLVAESVTRRVLRWYFMWSAMILVGAIGLLSAGSSIVAGCMSPFVLAALLRLAHARRVQRMLEHPEAIATRRGVWLFAMTPTDVAKLRASDHDFVQARRDAVPGSIAR